MVWNFKHAVKQLRVYIYLIGKKTTDLESDSQSGDFINNDDVIGNIFREWSKSTWWGRRGSISPAGCGFCRWGDFLREKLREGMFRKYVWGWSIFFESRKFLVAPLFGAEIFSDPLFWGYFLHRGSDLHNICAICAYNLKGPLNWFRMLLFLNSGVSMETVPDTQECQKFSFSNKYFENKGMVRKYVSEIFCCPPVPPSSMPFGCKFFSGPLLWLIHWL